MSKFAAPNALIGISIVGVLAATCTALFTRPVGDKLRAKVVKVALAEPSTSPRVNEYWKDTLSASDYAGGHPTDWCGTFILWALHQTGLAKNVKWIVGKGFIYPSSLPMTSDPKIGDVAYFTHNQHQALVKSVNNDGTVTLINGNGENGHITQSTTNKSNVTAFYSIQPFIDEGTT